MFEETTIQLADYQHLFFIIGIISALIFLLSLVAIPAVIKRLPSDYFINKKPPNTKHWLLRILLSVIKNTLGLTLICAGIIMLITPGQGLLSILAGIFICDFPGKRAFEHWLVLKPSIKKCLNWIRRKQDCEDFIIY